MTTGGEVTRVIVMRLRDEVSRQMERMGDAADRTRVKMRNLGDTMQRSSHQMILLGSAMVSAAHGATELGKFMGILDEDQARVAASGIQAAGGVLAIVGAISMLSGLAVAGVPVLLIIGAIALGVVIGVAAFKLWTAVSDDLARAWDRVVRAGAAVVSAIKRVVELMALPATWLLGNPESGQGGLKGLMGFQTAEGESKRVPGPSGRGMLAMVHGGETIGRPGGAGGGVTINISAGAIAQPRELAIQIGRILQQEKRTRGFAV